MALHIKEFLHTLIHQSQDWKANLLRAWPTIIGALHDKVHIEKIYDDTIILGVFHSCWMQELYLLSPLLIKTINEKLDLPRIKNIRFKQAGIKKKKDNTTPHRETQTRIPIVLTHQDEQALLRIADPALRETLRTFRIRCYRE